MRGGFRSAYRRGMEVEPMPHIASTPSRRVALVTGASRGLGATVAAFLAATGHDLVIDARGGEALEATADALRAHGGRVAAVPGDVADAAHRRRLVDAAHDLGGLDLLINNASTLGASPLPTLADLTEDTLRTTLEVNLIAPLALVRAALPLLERRQGTIVNVSSDAAVGGYEGWGGYGASKAALDLATKTLAAELAPRAVAAVAVDPGDLRTELHQLAFPGEDIGDRPEPDVTLPFWAWLVAQPGGAVSGQRFRAQEDVWRRADVAGDPAPVVVR
jgi:NAD(P)-dependent dehydrogenase (short-subunit alcohol dehydrogenase family)